MRKHFACGFKHTQITLYHFNAWECLIPGRCVFPNKLHSKHPFMDFVLKNSFCPEMPSLAEFADFLQ